MKQRITGMYCFGPHWRVHLECGHVQQVLAQDLKRLQLFIGKRIECGQCGQKIVVDKSKQAG